MFRRYDVIPLLSRSRTHARTHTTYTRAQTPGPEDDKLWLVMEFCGGGSITDLVKKMVPKKLPEPVFAFLLNQTLEALKYLHANGVVHRDIKGQNILMTDGGEVRLIDFGVSAQNKANQTKRNTFIGTPYWMAPEVIATDQQDDAWYDQRSDIWSLGITTIEIADTEPPLSDVHPMRALFLIPRNAPPELPDKKKWSRGLNEFVNACLEKNFEKRQTAEQLLQHPYTKKIPRSGREQMVEMIERYRGASKKTADGEVEPEDNTLGPDNETRSLGSAASVGGAGLHYEDGVDASGDVDTLTRQQSQRSASPMEKMPRGSAAGGMAQLGLVGRQGDSKEGAIRPLGGSASKTSLNAVMDTGAGNPGAGATNWAMDSGGGGGGSAVVPEHQGQVSMPGFGSFGGGGGGGGGAAAARAAIPQQQQQQMPGLKKMPEIRKFKRAFKSEILCASFWHSNLVVGSKNGLLLLDRSDEGKVHPLISRRRFSKIDVLSETGVMITVSGKKGKLRAYSLQWFRQYAQNKALAKGYQQFTPIGDINDCTHYQVARYERMLFLCVAHGMKVSVFLWAPAPYSRFMVFKEFEVPQQPQKVNLSIGEDESLRLIYAAATGFFSIDVSSGQVLNLYRPRGLPKTGIVQHEVVLVPDPTGGVKTLLLYDKSGVIIDKYGDVEAEVPFEWSEKPSSIALADKASLLGWGQKSIEIRACSTGVQEGVFKHKNANALTYLCTRGNKVFFASLRSSTDCQIYFMVF